jgi:hypothetical protein
LAGLTALRRLELQAQLGGGGSTAIEGLSRLTALEDLCLDGECGPMAQPSDLAPLTALTRLAMLCVPPDLGSHPAAARLRRLELQAFGVLFDAPRGGDGSGANGAAAAALAALARGAPLLERLRIRVGISSDLQEPFPMGEYPGGVELGAPLGPGVAWPSLTHLQVTPWAALLLAACAFPRLSRLAAAFTEEGGNRGISSNERLRTAVAALAGKARDHAALLIEDQWGSAYDAAGVLAAAAAIPGLRHLTLERSGLFGRVPAAPSRGDWARLAASLESLELTGHLATFGHAEPLAALTGLTQLFLTARFEDQAPAAAAPLPPAGGPHNGGEPPMGPGSSESARAARALARLPRLVHLRLAFPRGDLPGESLGWGSPVVAAELARCPALRLLEIDRRDDPLWRHERLGPHPGMPRPSPTWPPFAEALRAGGCGAAVRPASSGAAKSFELEC